MQIILNFLYQKLRESYLSCELTHGCKRNLYRERETEFSRNYLEANSIIEARNIRLF